MNIQDTIDWFKGLCESPTEDAKSELRDPYQEIHTLMYKLFLECRHHPQGWGVRHENFDLYIDLRLTTRTLYARTDDRVIGALLNHLEAGLKW